MRRARSSSPTGGMGSSFPRSSGAAACGPRLSARAAPTPMTVLDLVVIAMVALSILFAYFRGMVREVVALAAWIAGLVAAFRYMEPVATIFSGLDVAPPVRHVLAF